MNELINDPLRAPPDEIERHRQGLIAEEIAVLFERLHQLGLQVNAVESRRDRLGSRLTDPALLEKYPEGTVEHHDANNRYAELKLLGQRLHVEIYVLAGSFLLKLKRLRTWKYDEVRHQLGSGYKDEPIWGILDGIDVVKRSREWADFVGAMRSADDGRPPF